MITLNQDQTEARDELVNFIRDDTDNRIILTGSAGTGKTVTIVQVMKDIRDSNAGIPLDWFFTATTNKAKQAIQINLPNQEVSTIHSLLGLRPYRGNLIKSQNARDKLGDRKCVLVVDECSYIDKKLLKFIDEISDKIKVIFIGDRNQLTPVKSTTCPVFEQGYDLITLTTPVRQTKAPKIAAICNKFKAFIESDGAIPFPLIELSDEIIRISSEEFQIMTEKVFIIDESLTLHHRVLAGTNNVVNHHNTHLFGLANGRTELVAGDTVVSNHYVKSIKTDEEVIIEGKAPYKSHIPDCNGTTFFLMTMKASVEVYVPDSPKKALKAIEDILDADDHLDKEEASYLYDSLADLRPMYSSTVHKSQGSTFETVYIDLGSLSHVRSPVALARLLYVAISRASKQVVLTGDIQ